MGRRADGLMLKRKYQKSFFIVVLVVDLLLTCALFLQYSGNQISRTTEYSTGQLQQVGRSLDILYESMEAKVKQIMVDPDTVTFLHSTSIDRLQEGKVGVRLRAMRSSDTYIRYITLYNTATGHFVSSSSAGFGEELLADTIFDVPEGDAFFCFLRPIGSSYNTQAVKSVMVYTFVFPVQLTAQETDYIIIDVNDSYFNSTLEPIRLSGREQQLVFLDSHQQVISHMTAASEQAGFSISSELTQDLSSFAEDRGDSGSFFYWDGSRGRRFATFAHVPLTGWTIYNIMPSGTVLEGIASAMALTLALAAVTLTFGYILSRRVSSSLYAPIQSLFESFVSPESQKKRGNELELLSEAFSDMYARANRLEQGLTASYRDSKQMYLRHLLFGEQNQLRSAATAFQRLDIDLSAPGYGVALMQCVPQLPDQEENLFICYYALENISRELLATPRGMEFMRVGENRFAALLYLDGHELEPRFLAGLERIAEIMGREFHIDTTICLGEHQHQL